jgi:hypothetical protein
MPLEYRGKTGKAEQHVGSSKKGSGITMPKLGIGSKAGTNRRALEVTPGSTKIFGAHPGKHHDSTQWSPLCSKRRALSRDRYRWLPTRYAGVYCCGC